MKIVVINGSAESGKDKFVRYVKQNEKYDYTTINISTINPSKEALRILGWDGKFKTEETRQAMVDLKRISMKLFNGPFKHVVEQIKGTSQSTTKTNWVFFVHCREPEEIQKLVDHYKQDCTTLLIRSPKGKVLKNGSDDVVENYNYDHIINNESIEELKQEAILFANNNLIQE